jgi:hypothetical protein
MLDSINYTIALLPAVTSREDKRAATLGRYWIPFTKTRFLQHKTISSETIDATNSGHSWIRITKAMSIPFYNDDTRFGHVVPVQEMKGQHHGMERKGTQHELTIGPQLECLALQLQTASRGSLHDGDVHVLHKFAVTTGTEVR